MDSAGYPMFPHIRDAMSPDMSSREELGRISFKSLDDEDELPDHLVEPLYDEDEDLEGPVPRQNGNDVYVMMDPFAKDFSIFPTK